MCEVQYKLCFFELLQQQPQEVTIQQGCEGAP